MKNKQQPNFPAHSKNTGNFAIPNGNSRRTKEAH